MTRRLPRADKQTPTAVFRLREAMEAAGITNVSEFARNAGVSRPTIYEILNNTAEQVHLRTLGRLAFALGLQSPGDLVTWDRSDKK